AEDGIRDRNVTGVQTCALPIFAETIDAFPKGSLILVDLFGGTPCNQVMRYVQEKGQPLEVVGGMNLPMLVNSVIAREEKSGKELDRKSVVKGKRVEQGGRGDKE